MSPPVWGMLSLPAAVAIVNVLIGLLGGLRSSLNDTPIGMVAVPLIHTGCLERVVTYVKMAHICEVGDAYGWEQQITLIFFFFYLLMPLLSMSQGKRPGGGARSLPIANSTGK